MRVRLAPGIYLRGGEASGARAVLVCPDGDVQLNSMAAAILELCDGSRDREQIVAEILHKTDNRASSPDIIEIQDAAGVRGWVQGA